MSTNCPRCASAKTAQMHVGMENGQPLWTVWHCQSCAYTWRDSEPAASIDPQSRPAWAQLQGVDFDSLRQVIPPAGK
ncbi:MAG: non-oxidative hydroxyarylic acid decarboxylases subunit D [Rugosibacter sp.]